MSGKHQSGRRGGRLSIAVAALAGMVLAACGGAEGGTDGTMRVVLLEPDRGTSGLLEAFERMEGDGYSVELTTISEPELAIEGLANGDYDLSAESMSPALVGIERGADIRVIADVIGNQFAVYSQAGVTSCEDLDGEPFGLLSEGAVATAMIHEWLAESCPDVTPNFLVAGRGPVRMQALISEELAATPLQIADEISLAASGYDFNLLVDFGAELPELNSQTVYANADFLNDQPEVAQAFMDHHVDVMNELNNDPQVFVDLVEKHVPQFVDEELEAIAERYVEGGLFDADMITEESIAYTLEFFEGAGVLSGGLTVDEVADLSFINESRGR